jgi:hypothetical protein
MIGTQELCDMESRAVVAHDDDKLRLVVEVRRLHLELAQRARLAAKRMLEASNV